MRNNLFRILPALQFILAFVLVACGSESNTNTDAGMDDGNTGPRPCLTDADCDSPETCQENGYCEYKPGPDPKDNKLAGSFSCEMNVSSYGESTVTGMFNGKSIFMEYPGCKAKFDPEDDPMAILVFDGIVTNELVFRLVVKVPNDSPTDTDLKFGVGGIATGVFKFAELNSDGYVVGETPKAEVTGGRIVFGHFGNAQGNQIDGTFSVELKPIVNDQ